MLPRLMIVDLLLMMQVQILNSLAVRLLRAFSARFVLHYLHHFRFVETENFFLVHQNALSAHSHALTQTHGAKARSNHVVPSFMIVFALPFTSRFCSRLSFAFFSRFFLVERLKEFLLWIHNLHLNVHLHILARLPCSNENFVNQLNDFCFGTFSRNSFFNVLGKKENNSSEKWQK